ncbi:MAG: DUF2029 domain-containing protein [Kiritimatiellae bacterium]|nr:DUF2029 domain-containing protein [Kiritimatiellia bacterium]
MEKTGWRRSLFPVVVLLVSLAALGYEVHNLVFDYVVPLARGQFAFFADFQFFCEGAQRFLSDPKQLYEGNTRDGFLMIESATRIDYGYPPPAVLWFVPLALLPMAWAFALFTLFSVMLVVLSVLLFRRLYREGGGRPESAGWWVLAGVVVLSLGSTYVTLIFGQVNAIVLLLCLGYVFFVRKGAYGIAGVLMAVGFWLKFYPVFLLVLAPFERRPLRLLLCSGAAIVLLPLVLSPILPLSLYARYFREVYPALAGQTAPHVYNQSLTAYLTRWALPRDMLFNWGPVLVQRWILRVNHLATLGVLGWLAYRYHKTRQSPLLYYACVMAAVPLLVTYGWGGTYLLGVPLFLLLFKRASGARSWAWPVLGIALAALLLPAYRPFDLGHRLGPVVEHLYYNRYFLVVIAGLVCVTWPARREKAV